MTTAPLTIANDSLDGPLAVVVPILQNRARALPRLLSRLSMVLDQLDREYQIIVVDDGSTDGSAMRAQEAETTRPVMVIRHDRSYGVGRALLTGLLHAVRHSAVVVTLEPGEGHDPALITRLLSELEDGSDVAIAGRPASGVEAAPEERRVVSAASRALLMWTATNGGKSDSRSRYRAYRGKLLRRLVGRYGETALIKEQGVVGATEVLAKARLEGARIVEIPWDLKDVEQRTSGVPVLSFLQRFSGRRSVASTAQPATSSELPLRLLNVAAASLGLVLAAPIMLMVALLIRLTSPGPIIYMQTRVGLDRRQANGKSNARRRVDHGGKPFQIYKFRTMSHAAHEASQQVWARPDDPRVTPIGRVLRKYRLDELPQLVNVIKGEMNVVGPRPEQPQIFSKLRSQIDRYGQRQRVPPGITGWAQINHHYDRSMEDVEKKLSYDLEYVARRSVLEDFRIMLNTVPVVVFRRGAW